jgi:AcrR family transcriptional regulator
MPRQRFHTLDAAQQQRILDAALGEFAAHGFGDASLNRIIEAAGISKGSMYYYFDGKDDLYAHVIRDRLGRLLERAGPFPVPTASDPDQYWAALTADYLRLMNALIADPAVAGLLRGWLSGRSTPALSAAQDDAERDILPWLSRTLAAGQQIGAVRTDLPAELLIGATMALGRAIDTVLITQPPDDTDLEQTVATLIDLIRRVVAPG